MCLYGIPEILYKPPTRFEVIFDLVYDVEFILNIPYYSKEVEMKSYMITVYMVLDLHGMYVSHLYELKSPYNSFYIHVSSHWKNAYDRWANCR